MKFVNYLFLVVIFIVFGSCQKREVCVECTASDKSGNAESMVETECYDEESYTIIEFDKTRTAFIAKHDTTLYNVSCREK